jgi:uncharacterized RDD family membrane protein YckC
MSNTNPYAAPQADALDDRTARDAAKLTKAQRTNRINRRTVALLVDSLPYSLLIGVPVSQLLILSGHVFPGSTLLLYAPLYLLRDAFGAAGLGKRLVGLSLAQAGSDASPSMSARILRGVPLVIPFVSLVEYFVAYYGNEPMQRLGDKMAGTRVIDVAPERFGTSSWSWQLLLACVVAWALYVIEGMVIMALGAASVR